MHGLEEALARARRRVEQAVPYSPEWDAATDEVAELEELLADLAHDEPRPYGHESPDAA